MNKPADCFGDYFGSATMMACGCNDDTSCRDCFGNVNGGAVDLGCGCGAPGPTGCDNTCGSTKVLPHWGPGNGGACLPSCGILAGSSAQSFWSGSCESHCMADAGTAFDMPVCCVPNGRSAPHWGPKNGQCMQSCGGLGGDVSGNVPCASRWCGSVRCQSAPGGETNAFDVAHCCKIPA